MRILIRGTNWIGDSVMAIPAMRRLRCSFPDAHIVLHTRRWAEGIFRDADFLNEIIAYDGAGSKIRTVLDQSKILKEGKFDLAIIFPNSFESGFTTRLAGIPRRFGYRTDGRGFLLTNPIAIPAWKHERHESNYYLNIVEAVENSILGEVTNKQNVSTRLDVSAGRRTEAFELIKTFFADTTKPTIGFGAGSTNSMAKRWPAASFANLADMLATELKASIVLFGSAVEQDVAKELKGIANVELVDLTGKTDLSQATALLSVLDLFVSNDMGLAHISGAVGTPTLTIFGPTNATTTRPLGENVEIVRENVECSPCMLRVCPIDHRCMTRIKPEMVFETARLMLQNRTSKNDQ